MSSSIYFIVFLLCIVACTGDVPKISRRITNGTKAERYQFPYQATIVTLSQNQGHQCGATIISDRWLVTAAHCFPGFDHENNEQTIVKYGTHKLDHDDTLFAYVDRIFIHPNYTLEPFISNDIALIKLKKQMVLGGRIIPTRLPYAGQIFKSKAISSGHGYTKPPYNETSDDLLWIEVKILPDGDCLIYNVGQFKYDPKTMICAIAEKGKAVCGGDSGGPLVQKKYYGDNMLIGIASFAPIECGKHEFPFVYTKVSAYRNWIRKITLL